MMQCHRFTDYVKSLFEDPGKDEAKITAIKNYMLQFKLVSYKIYTPAWKAQGSK